jgi:hypothetical protein
VRTRSREMRPKRKPKFSRAVLPPSRFHTSKRGKKGYQRQEVRKEENSAKEREAAPGVVERG